MGNLETGAGNRTIGIIGLVWLCVCVSLLHLCVCYYWYIILLILLRRRFFSTNNENIIIIIIYQYVNERVWKSGEKKQNKPNTSSARDETSTQWERDYIRVRDERIRRMVKKIDGRNGMGGGTSSYSKLVFRIRRVSTRDGLSGNLKK